MAATSADMREMRGRLGPQWWLSITVVHDDGTVDPQIGNSCYAPTFYDLEKGVVYALFDHFEDQAVRVPVHLKGEKAFFSVALTDSGYMPSNSLVNMCRARAPADALIDAVLEAGKSKQVTVDLPGVGIYVHTAGEGRRQNARAGCERVDGHWKIMRLEVDAPPGCVENFAAWLELREKKSLIIPESIRVPKDDDETA